MAKGDGAFDVVVIGGGIGGLAAAALSEKAGLKTALLESHTRLGGCAGYFDRGPYTFDAGATALMGLDPGEPLADLLRAVGAELEAERTPTYRVHLPDRRLDIVPDDCAFEDAIARAFPGRDESRRHFWRLQASVGRRLFKVATGIPRLPARSLADLAYDLRLLGPGGLAAASTWLVTVLDVLRFLDLAEDVPFRSLVAMLLQDTAQAGPETVPFANAAACLQAYRAGMSRPRGGMQALAEGLGQAFASLGGDLRMATKADRVEAIDPDREGRRFVVLTRRRERLHSRHVAFNLPIDLAVNLLGRSLDGRLAGSERRSRAAWSAFTGYVAFRADAAPTRGPLFHQVLRSYDAPIHNGNNVLISLSPEDDHGYGPPGTRVATMSTHVRPADWWHLERSEYESKKLAYSGRLLEALGRALPIAPDALLHSEFATPRSFARYTRRKLGAVGGPPVRRGNSNFLAVGSDVLGPGLHLVGDSVFPGQGTMAVVLSAIRVVERLTGRDWDRMKIPPGRREATPPAVFATRS